MRRPPAPVGVAILQKDVMPRITEPTPAHLPVHLGGAERCRA